MTASEAGRLSRSKSLSSAISIDEEQRGVGGGSFLCGPPVFQRNVREVGRPIISKCFYVYVKERRVKTIPKESGGIITYKRERDHECE